MALMTGLGCQPKSDGPVGADVQAAPPAATDIPLRVWIAAPVAQAELLQRQWLAKSEQPLELRSLTVSELLEEPNCQCDVLVYPASLIGELVQRGWIVKQPSVPPRSDGQAVDEQAVDEQEAANAHPAWLAQATYADETMGLSLGCAVPVFVASSGLTDENGSLSWDEVMSRLQVAANDSPSFSFDEADVEADALVDRFLAVVASLSDRDPGYGMLFDLQSMQARLADPEYLQAAGILAGLAAQPDGLTSVIGSHSTAWTWSATSEIPALAIAAPILLDQPAAAITSGQILKLRLPAQRGQGKATASSTGASSGPLADRPQVAWWSSSGGLVASMSSRCRQSSQAQVCLQWMQSPTTRTVMSSLIPGIEAATPSSGNESLSWQTQRQLAQEIKLSTLSLEPRLPLADQYRQTLAEELQLFLSGKKDSSTALKDAARRWNETTRQAGATQRRNYEHSLNL